MKSVRVPAFSTRSNESSSRWRNYGTSGWFLYIWVSALSFLRFFDIVRWVTGIACGPFATHQKLFLCSSLRNKTDGINRQNQLLPFHLENGLKLWCWAGFLLLKLMYKSCFLCFFKVSVQSRVWWLSCLCWLLNEWVQLLDSHVCHTSLTDR